MNEVTTVRELESTTHVLETVKKQIDEYTSSLKKVVQLRQELAGNTNLRSRVMKSPKAMAQLLQDRGISPQLASGMAAEEFKDPNFAARAAGFWTWDCCCTNCCFTCWETHNSATNLTAQPLAEP